ncbi:hypothetical protein LOAG_01511 [Loa loa]|uniref:Uncharacterized protein n=1 Tax=Loa loa TaxID=7209 RepID=A0A1S0U8Q7_LOALO|nr:hypothetical protein LOAG_01511 [Loa loa]EFO26976.1 hypothetical protein LOAG_01511 [Loa loa]
MPLVLVEGHVRYERMLINDWLLFLNNDQINLKIGCYKRGKGRLNFSEINEYPFLIEKQEEICCGFLLKGEELEVTWSISGTKFDVMCVCVVRCGQKGRVDTLLVKGKVTKTIRYC